MLFTDTVSGTDISESKICIQRYSHSRGGRHMKQHKQYISELHDLLEDYKYDTKQKMSTQWGG